MVAVTTPDNSITLGLNLSTELAHIYGVTAVQLSREDKLPVSSSSPNLYHDRKIRPSTPMRDAKRHH